MLCRDDRDFGVRQRYGIKEPKMIPKIVLARLGAPPDMLPATLTGAPPDILPAIPPEMLPASAAEEIAKVKSDAQRIDLKRFILNFSW